MMIVVIMLLLSLALAPEIRPLRFITTTAFGQNSYLSNQLLSSFLCCLHDNGFRVLTMRNLAYDNNTNSLYLVNVPRPM
jgi:hypothetical protein